MAAGVGCNAVLDVVFIQMGFGMAEALIALFSNIANYACNPEVGPGVL